MFKELTMLCIVSVANAEDAFDIVNEADVLKESEKLMQKFKSDGMDAGIKAIVDEPYFITLSKENDKRVLIETFGEAGAVYDAYGGLSNNSPAFVGKAAFKDAYIKVVYLIPFNNGGMPLSLHWAKGVPGYHLVAVKMATQADDDLAVFLK